MSSNKRAGDSLEQPVTKGPRSVKLADSEFESSDSDSSDSGDESDPGSAWNSDVEVPPEPENEGVRDQDLNVGQAIQATCITVTHRDGTETQREGMGVVDSFDGRTGLAKIRFFGSDDYGTIEQGDHLNDHLWPCTNIPNPHEKQWVKFLVNVAALLHLPEDRVKCDETLALVEAILGFMKNPESMHYCSDRAAYFESNNNEEMYEAWGANAEALDNAGDNIEILEDYVNGYSTLDAAELSDLLGYLAQDDFPTAVSETE